MLCALLLRIVINSIGKPSNALCVSSPTPHHIHPHPISFYCELEFDIVLHTYRKQIQSVCVWGGRVCWLHSGNLHDRDSYLFSPPYQLHNLLVKLVPSLNHPDLQLSRIHKDEHDIQSLADLMETSWINPLRHDQVEFINFCLLLQLLLSDIAKDLIKAFKVGGVCIPGL